MTFTCSHLCLCPTYGIKKAVDEKKVIQLEIFRLWKHKKNLAVLEYKQATSFLLPYSTLISLSSWKAALNIHFQNQATYWHSLILKLLSFKNDFIFCGVFFLELHFFLMRKWVKLCLVLIFRGHLVSYTTTQFSR